MVTTQQQTLTLLNRKQKDVNERISCCSKILIHEKHHRHSIIKIRRQVFALLSSHVPLPLLLSVRTHFFGWMPFIAYVTEKYTSISTDCCCLLGSYHAIVTLVELMDPIGVCLSAPYIWMQCCYVQFCGFAAELLVLINAWFMINSVSVTMKKWHPVHHIIRLC